MVEGSIDVGSNCSKDITSASWQDGVQGLNYIPSSKGDENTNTGDEEVKIPLGSSTNKPVKKPYVRGGPKPWCKGKFIFLKYHSSGLYIHLSILGV
jgi:hypothetical protein